MSKHFLCTWCKGVLTSRDKIYTTSCGHIFHFGCMRKCQSQSTACPQCRCNNPGTYEMFVFFEKCEDENVANNWNDKMKIIEQLKEIEEINNNFQHLQGKYSVSQDIVRKLEEKNRIANNGISQRTAIISDLEDRIKVLEELNQFLTVDNECKSNSLILKSKEIAELKNSLVRMEKGATETNSNKQPTNKTLEKRFKNQSPTLKRDMPNGNELSGDKSKLQKYINLSKLDSCVNGKAENYSDGKVMTPNSRENRNEPQKQFLAQEHDSRFYAVERLESPKTPTTITTRDVKEDCSAISNSDSLNERNSINNTHPQRNSNAYANNSLFIKNFPKKDLMYPLKKVIKTFVVTREGFITDDDIVEVYVKDARGKNYHQLPTNVTLFVKFKNQELKMKFLLNRDQIQQVSPSLELIEVDKFNDGTKAATKGKSYDKTTKPKSKENMNKKGACTVSSLPSQNVLEKQFLAQKVKEDFHFHDSRFYAPKPLESPTITPSEESHLSKCQSSPAVTTSGTASITEDYSIISISECSTDSDSSICTRRNDNLNSSASDESIFIKNVPKTLLKYPLKKFILEFVVTKEGYISEDDIAEVYVKDGLKKAHSKLPKKVTLYVQFTNRDFKTKFLLNRAHIQKSSPSLEFIEIDKYNHDKSEELFQYAKQKLKGNGFNYFFHQNEEVMALKDRSDTEGLLIRSKSHVNKLLKLHEKN